MLYNGFIQSFIKPYYYLKVRRIIMGMGEFVVSIIMFIIAALPLIIAVLLIMALVKFLRGKNKK